jgi:hypothetical protein
MDWEEAKRVVLPVAGLVVEAVNETDGVEEQPRDQEDDHHDDDAWALGRLPP